MLFGVTNLKSLGKCPTVFMKHTSCRSVIPKNGFFWERKWNDGRSHPLSLNDPMTSAGFFFRSPCNVGNAGDGTTPASKPQSVSFALHRGSCGKGRAIEGHESMKLRVSRALWKQKSKARKRPSSWYILFCWILNNQYASPRGLTILKVSHHLK